MFYCIINDDKFEKTKYKKTIRTLQTMTLAIKYA